MKNKWWILPVIIIAQFTGTSLWFAGNAVISSFPGFDPGTAGVGLITSAVQLGFIAGTLIFAVLTVSDRYSPSLVFFLSTAIASIANAGMIGFHSQVGMLVALRFITGFFLAGIYPVGMKVAADWHEKGLGKALGYLVGALVIGTAFPHLIKGSGGGVENWQWVLVLTSSLALAGGLLLFVLVPDGPYRKRSPRMDWMTIPSIFRNKSFRAAAFGYFGHMWELYTFWAFVPLIMVSYSQFRDVPYANQPLLVFLVIAAGGVACILGGYLSELMGSRRVATSSLAISGLCCCLAPWSFYFPFDIFFIYLLIWGMAVVADSPQFSTLVAKNAEKEVIGTALTMTNCIGFSITIISIQVFNVISNFFPLPQALLLLALGPAFGLWSVFRLSGKTA